MTTVLRWLLVLPAAALGFAVAQIVTILVTAFWPDSLSQLVGAAATPLGFVLLGTRVAPNWKRHISGILAILMILFHGVVLGGIFVGLVRKDDLVVMWLSIPLGIVGSVAGYCIVYAQEMEQRLGVTFGDKAKVMETGM